MLREMDSARLTGWLAYLKLDDEQQMVRMNRAIMGTGKRTQADDDEDEEVIDTTAPEFAEQFQGFVNHPNPVNTAMNRSHTEIVMG